ncbi:hypothetical protein BU23DRAFT_551571 [Bimuria novae-zelandiae CBS 107.79]|uniref:Glycosyltransferase family 1 protein n=1 Tax=Bimuria novae-zelandiae CBS 107.79 TaxID=1447943 RepID=A0A6A5VJ05_9PLEO|nr:hypothetical protein BU23DRAFT_551571 [Bimuria novae-zelandiae CBS 107.79]
MARTGSIRLVDVEERGDDTIQPSSPRNEVEVEPHPTSPQNERVTRPSSRQSDEHSNADLYAPPAYTITSTPGEASLDVEAFVPEKTPLLTQNQTNPPDEGDASGASPSYPASLQDASPLPSPLMPARKPIDWASNTTSLRCSVLPSRPATWTVRGKKGMALSPLAAAVLVREGILPAKHLSLVPSLLERPSPTSLINPTDPLSAVIISTYDILGDVLLGVAGGPIEVASKVGSARVPETREQLSLLYEGGGHARESTNDTLMVGPKALVHYCNGTYKGVRKLVEAGLKSPMTYTHSLTRGFHNMPKLYGESIREREEVVDLKSGLVVSGKALGYGIFDGVKDFFWMPVVGARKEGAVGLGKGIAKGFGNMLCNMGEAGVGLVGYSSYGIYKEIHKTASGGHVSARNVVLTLGEAELEQASEEERKNVIKTWLHVQMRQHR